MIDMKSGKAIGIDFGMAFGHGTINLPIPELTPIRLTRQILKLIAPLEHNGLFETSMFHTLRALRENNDLLMCILDVFIKEPSTDWAGNAARIANKQIAKQSMASNDINLNDENYKVTLQYAESRIKSTKDKLDGINPCVITRNDLANSINKDSQYLEYIINAVTGSNSYNNNKSKIKLERNEILKQNGDTYRLTIEEQVKCIIEQSTDPDILGRTYIGWQPYI
jgi:DNA-dependent protein kinase catalytic subunit